MSEFFFCINPKHYLIGDEFFNFLKFADDMAKEYSFDIYFTCPAIYLYVSKLICKNLLITAQNCDFNTKRSSMGTIYAEDLKYVGASAVVLNHASKKINMEGVESVVRECEKMGLKTIVCASSIYEVGCIADFNPTIMVCEQENLIGTGIISDENYIKTTTELIHQRSLSTKVSQSAGIRKKEDIINAFRLGADGTGVTSGIFCARNPKEKLKEFLDATAYAIERYGKKRVYLR